MSVEQYSLLCAVKGMKKGFWHVGLSFPPSPGLHSTKPLQFFLYLMFRTNLMAWVLSGDVLLVVYVCRH